MKFLSVILFDLSRVLEKTTPNYSKMFKKNKKELGEKTEKMFDFESKNKEKEGEIEVEEKEKKKNKLILDFKSQSLKDEKIEEIIEDKIPKSSRDFEENVVIEHRLKKSNLSDRQNNIINIEPNNYYKVSVQDESEVNSLKEEKKKKLFSPDSSKFNKEENIKGKSVFFAVNKRRRSKKGGKIKNDMEKLERSLDEEITTLKLKLSYIEKE